METFRGLGVTSEVTGDVLDRVRAACAEVAARATSVRIDESALDRMAATLDPAPPPLLPEETGFGDEATTVAAVLAWNAVNFGSGWFPHVTKRPGRSGARSLAANWHDHVTEHGVPEAERLAGLTADDVARIFRQPPMAEPVRGLMLLFTRALNDLGRLLLDRYGGDPVRLVGAADHSAARLVELLDEMPLFHDVHRYGDLEVPLYKRAQITSSQLAAALDGRGAGRFDDLDRLTLFADNLVPHVLRIDAVLDVDPALVQRIERGELLEPGSPDEVELRAVAVHAVELLSRRSGTDAATIDHQLWQRGQGPAYKARPRHRCRCPYY